MRGTSLFTLFGCALAVVACSDPSPLEPGLIQPPEAPVFAKPVADPGPLWRLPLDDAGLGLVSDRRQQSGIFSVYEDGVCGVTGKIFTGGSGDATLQTNNPRQKNTTCQTARTMSLVYPTGDPVYPAGGVETMLVFVNLRNISNSITTIAPGYENRVERMLSLNPTQTERCDAWRWTSVSFNGDNVWVERLDATTYHVYTKDRDPVIENRVPGANRATCTTTGQLHSLSVDLYVVSRQALP